jgi:NADPH:quinone reductase
VRQIQFSRFGGPEVLEMVERPTPVPGVGEVLVEVAAIGVNFSDTLIRENRYAVTPALPAVPGIEVAGTVASLGKDVRGLPVGTRVVVPLFATGAATGGYTDYVVANADILVPLPDALSFEVALALMMQGLTALYLARLITAPGKIVLINAAAGGVGSLLMQLVRRAGASRVIAAVGSLEKIDHVRSLGADVAIDYTKADWINAVRVASDGNGPDIIFESAGGAVTQGSLALLAPGGQIVIYGALNIQSFALGIPELINLIFKNQSLTGFALPTLLTASGLKTGLAELFSLVASSELEVTIGGTYPLSLAHHAHRALESRNSKGKLILVP